ncbi:MAG: hypothetical protein MUO40_06700 [Anaerolineaceae bacterium]|nr:hypothetical protein [Anaerolineaceae bacterium]
MDGSVKIMASGPEDVISEFIRDLEMDHPDTTIETMEIVEDIGLPSPFGRIELMISESIWQGSIGVGLATRIINASEYYPPISGGIITNIDD